MIICYNMSMIILFGLAGSGKGTQGKALAEFFGWRTLSVGQAIRNTGAYDDVINNGNLIPDDEVIKIMAKQIDRAEQEGFDIILDGYPRTGYQAKWLMEHMPEKIDGAIILEVPKEELYQRLALRGRTDDKERESIDRRFDIFEKNIEEILPVLEAHNVPVLRANGVGPVGTVTGRLIAAIQTLNQSATKQPDDVNGGEIERSYGE